MIQMENELRWDPLLQEWVIIASNRTDRPVLGKTFSEEKSKHTCPFCPDAPEGAGNWIVKAVPNRFPSLVSKPNISFLDNISLNRIYEKRPGKGICEVILYTQDHDKTFGDLSISNIESLIELWKSRFQVSMGDPELKYTLIMENRGKEMGVTLTHPHGQLYSFPFIPPKIEKELRSSQSYWDNKGKCLFCEIIKVEKENNSRIVAENENFIAFIPYFAKWPFEIHIYPKKHIPYILDVEKENNGNFAGILKTVIRKLDELYGFIMPYTMIHHNAPYNSDDCSFFHYHIEIYPLFRGKDRLKILGGVELGTNTFINPSNPEENAQLLRNIKIDI